MSYKLIEVMIEDNIGTITFNNGALNILDIAMMQEINQALDSLISKKKELKAVVLAHGGKSFSAGVDVGDHMGDKAAIMLREFHTIFKKLNSLPCPTIAAVKGSALGGGCEVAMFCDMILASEKAKFGQPEIKVGVFPPLAALILPKIIGKKLANELILQGEIITAQRAYEMGLVNVVYSLEEFDTQVDKYLARFKALSTVVIQHTKKAMNRVEIDDFDTKIDDLEQYYLEELMKTKDANIGLQAFLDKRLPNWTNE